ncbi:nuclear transport factor 2 family protein [Planotetraspora sp. A-T 1434]|uniref:nuclear transport factor 2 family protein n=1 Tax=Planotetraspora sp. A-T 1434 TaxID=2979219 RepID=UPI0021C1E077|nr:nuclear transport factor 2 family protein [Planotetraspora sp. A-T 1434]MCT9933072.1 nuclear transport factor 2 family protein [Planotetraspora sp. A-T 1434]
MTLTPREAFTRWQQAVLAGSPDQAHDRTGDHTPDHTGDHSAGEPYVGDLNADDVVVEWPFNPPGRPRRIEGRAAFDAIAKAGRDALPVRFEEFRDVVVHETADPEVIIAEYELTGTILTTGRQASAHFVTVLRVRDGKIVHVREYQDVLAMADALGQLPALLRGMTVAGKESPV